MIIKYIAVFLDQSISDILDVTPIGKLPNTEQEANEIAKEESYNRKHSNLKVEDKYVIYKVSVVNRII